MAIDWASRLAAAAARRDAAKAKLSDDDVTELAERKREEEINAEAAKLEQDAREIGLARRFEAARERLGEDAQIAPVTIEDRDDTFILQHDAKAHAKWDKEIAEAHSNKKLDKAEVNRNYAVALVIDWNGIADWAVGNLNGTALHAHLRANPGMVTPLVNEGARLAGFFAKARKS